MLSRSTINVLKIVVQFFTRSNAGADFALLKDQPAMLIRESVYQSNFFVRTEELQYVVPSSPTRSINLGCGAGTYYHFKFGFCMPCPVNTYQPKTNSLDCIPCPGRSNKHGRVSLTKLEDCPGICQAGSYSRTGAVPCEPCPLGSFQSDRGRTHCNSCGKNITTSLKGSTSFTDCRVKELCSAGQYYSMPISRCVSCPKGTYQPNVGKRNCLECPLRLSTDSIGSTSIEDCKDYVCRSRIRRKKGFLESPNYPGNYPTNVSCVWTLKSGRRRGLLLIIPVLQLAKNRCGDYLMIRRTASPYSTMTWEECGPRNKPLILVSRTRKLWIQFKSDNHGTAKGFHLRYVTFKEELRPLMEDIVQDLELFSSPNYRVFFKNEQFLSALVDVVSQPNNYRKYFHFHKLFPRRFLEKLWLKLHRFFDLPDLENLGQKRV